MEIPDEPVSPLSESEYEERVSDELADSLYEKAANGEVLTSAEQRLFDRSFTTLG